MQLVWCVKVMLPESNMHMLVRYVLKRSSWFLAGPKLVLSRRDLLKPAFMLQSIANMLDFSTGFHPKQLTNEEQSKPTKEHKLNNK